MKKKLKRDIRKEYNFLFVIAIVSVLFGVFCLCIPMLPSTTYGKLKEKEIVIVEFARSYGVRGAATYDYIKTNDNEKYNITGDYKYSELKDILTEGTTATIKWYENKIFFGKYAEEMTVDGKLVVSYNNDAETNWTAPIIFFHNFCFIGLLFTCFKVLSCCERQAKKAKEKRSAAPKKTKPLKAKFPQTKKGTPLSTECIPSFTIPQAPSKRWKAPGGLLFGKLQLYRIHF